MNRMLLLCCSLLSLLACTGSTAPATPVAVPSAPVTPVAAPVPATPTLPSPVAPAVPAAAPSANVIHICNAAEKEVFACNSPEGLPMGLCLMEGAGLAEMTLVIPGQLIKINADKKPPSFTHYAGEGQNNDVLTLYHQRINYDISEINAGGQHYGVITILTPQNAPNGQQIRCQELPRTNWSLVQAWKR